MAKRQFELDETEIRQLRGREQQTDSVAELKRLQAVRLYGSGMDMGQIRDMTGCAESSVREWVQDYKHEGLEGLRPHYALSAQNASKLTVAQRAEVYERLHAYQPDQILAPTLRISAGQFWTVSDLHLALEAWYGVVYEDPGSYRDVFAACEFSYQRAERVYKSRPSQAQIADFEAELEKK
jgi:transposase